MAGPALEPVRGVLAGPAPPRRLRCRVAVHHPVIADADQDLHLIQMLAQVPGQRGLVVPGVVHVQRDARLSVRAQPRGVPDDHLRRLGGGVVPHSDPGHVLRRGPRAGRERQLGQPLERPARDHRVPVPAFPAGGAARARAGAGPAAAAVMPLAGMRVPLPARAGIRGRPRIGARVDRENQRPAPRPVPHQQVPQPLLIDPPLAQGLVHHAVPAPEARLQAQVRQRPRRRRGQHGVRQLEQSVRPSPQAPVELLPEPRQPRQRLPGPRQALLARLPLHRHTGKHGRCPFSGSCYYSEDAAAAHALSSPVMASEHAKRLVQDLPRPMSRIRPIRQNTLKRKLRRVVYCALPLRQGLRPVAHRPHLVRSGGHRPHTGGARTDSCGACRELARASAMTLAGSRPRWSRYCGPSLAGGEPPGTGGESRATRWNSTRAAGIRSCSRASRASARASAAVGRFRSRARGHSRA